MDATPTEREAVRLAWESRHPGQEPSPEDEASTLVEVRERARRIEEEALQWGMSKLAKPPRAGLWSRTSPRSIGWALAGILFAVSLIGLALALALSR